MRDAVEDDFIFILTSDIVENVLAVLDGHVSNGLGLLDVRHVEEDTGVAKSFFVRFGARNGDFVDFNGIVEERLDYPFDLFFQVFIIEVFGFILLDFFFSDTMGF